MLQVLSECGVSLQSITLDRASPVLRLIAGYEEREL